MVEVKLHWTEATMFCLGALAILLPTALITHDYTPFLFSLFALPVKP